MRQLNNNPYNKAPNSADGPRINEHIRATELRVISDSGEQLGILPLREALERAREYGLDLVEVSPDAKPPVCKLMDYGKFKYQQSKKNHEAKKKQSVIEIKEINLTPNTGKNDILTKQNYIKGWLTDKARVRIGVKFRGRELSHIELGRKILDELLLGLEQLAVPEAPAKIEGKRLVITLLPK